MFTSFDENAFMKAIEEKNYLRLKVDTVSSMLNDPTFERGETDKVLKILDEKVPEIFEDEVKLDYEERLERSEWDKRYFTKLTYWFQENFAKSRVQYIKEVGNAVHKDTAQKYRDSLNNQSISPQKNVTKNPIKAPAEKIKKFPIWGIVTAAAALVLVVVLLVKVLLK